MTSVIPLKNCWLLKAISRMFTDTMLGGGSGLKNLPGFCLIIGFSCNHLVCVQLNLIGRNPVHPPPPL